MPHALVAPGGGTVTDSEATRYRSTRSSRMSCSASASRAAQSPVLEAASIIIVTIDWRHPRDEGRRMAG
eukprot:1992570-Prymnesium_polylepis.1